MHWSTSGQISPTSAEFKAILYWCPDKNQQFALCFKQEVLNRLHPTGWIFQQITSFVSNMVIVTALHDSQINNYRAMQRAAQVCTKESVHSQLQKSSGTGLKSVVLLTETWPETTDLLDPGLPTYPLPRMPPLPTGMDAGLPFLSLFYSKHLLNCRNLLKEKPYVSKHSCTHTLVPPPGRNSLMATSTCAPPLTAFPAQPELQKD